MSLSIDYSDNRFELGKNTLILGPRHRGKTNLILTNIFLKFQSKINYLFVVSNDEKYLEITSHLFTEEQMPKIFQEIQCLDRTEQKLLIVDEVMNHGNPIWECLLINSHYFNVSIVLVSKMGNFNMMARDNLHTIAIGCEKCVTLARDFFEKYGTNYNDFSQFFTIISELGKDQFLWFPKGKMYASLIRVNDHWIKYLYSYKMFVRYDLLVKINAEKKSGNEDLVKKVEQMMEELVQIKKKLQCT